MKLFYGANTERMPEGATFRNHAFFDGVADPDASTVYLEGDYPRIQEAYEAKGVSVVRLDGVSPPADPEAQFPVDPAEQPLIPADWRNLPWTQPDERGLTLKGLASQVSENTIRSKDDAVAAIEDYLAGGLDKPLADAGGLTRRQLNADLEALGLDIEADEAPADTVARIAEKRQSEADDGSD